MIAVFHITPTFYLVLAAALFSIGAVGLLVRRNVLVMFMCIELMLNAVNLTFVAFAKAAEVAVGLAIIVAILRRRREATADDLRVLEG